MILFLDTSDFDIIHFALIDEVKNSIAKEKRFKLSRRDSNKITAELGKFLPAKLKEGKGLSKIVLVSGPGSFTGIRIGVAVSLAFSLAWDVEVFALEKNDVPVDLVGIIKSKKFKKVNRNFKPEYGAEPTITPSNK
jgi:tRNA A37 threonylcarbamoyladenosine modification protein TsaB